MAEHKPLCAAMTPKTGFRVKLSGHLSSSKARLSKGVVEVTTLGAFYHRAVSSPTMYAPPEVPMAHLLKILLTSACFIERFQQ